MRNLILVLAFLLSGSIAVKGKNLYVNDKDTLLHYFDDAKAQLLASIDGLSDEQFNFKPDANSWSIGQCVEHIAKTEGMLRDMVIDLLAKPANPEKRGEIKTSGAQVVSMMQDRSFKAEAPEMLRPQSNTYNLKNELAVLEKERNITLDLINDTPEEELRNHITITPAKEYTDAYRFLLYIAGHSLRHTAQIEEIKKASGFPKQ
ncbi:DinB family protein [Olivibacter sp. SDN3]|uniref:DinB family protein n=1 Tax=Olivibacter sp. SDN3 TaxID=2764720 RepID=UPI001651063B|nr:DinB family protein [Olivibacter sp. SDN3]QNL50206.1 DinB family protein [Olivibacter sp. SDN3]